MNAHEVDALLRAPAVVFGSLPPDGRDLDLLVAPDQLRDLEDALLREGWQRSGKTFARFGAGTAFAVDVVDVESWAPSPRVAVEVQKQAVALDGYTHLLAPADQHRLLILARRHAAGARIDARKRRLVETFDDATWRAARTEAADWGLAGPLEQLRESLATGRESLPSRGLRPALPGRRGPLVIALSGLDGAGKSTHAELLRTALESLGHDASIQWTKIARDEWLKAVAAPVRRIVNAAFARGAAKAEPTGSAVTPDEDPDGETRNYPDGPPPPPDPAKLLRQRSALLTTCWTFALALANATTHRREVRRRGTRIVICDRYVLDSMAHLRYRYGYERSFRRQGAVVRLLSPRPVAAFLIDVSPATARARKPEQYTTADLTRLRECYLDAAARLPVTVVDGERPMEAVAAQIASETWLRLSERRLRRRRPW